MTLIELLVAITIATLLTGIAFAIYRAAIDGSRVETGRRRNRLPVAAALDLMASDLARSFQPAGSSKAALILGPGTNDVVRTRLCFAFAHSLDLNNGGFYDASYVHYLLLPGEDEGFSIIRRRFPVDDVLSEDYVLEDELVLDDVRLWQVVLFNGHNWTNAWGDDPESGLPLAARICLETDGAAMEAEILIPAAIKIGDE